MTIWPRWKEGRRRIDHGIRLLCACHLISFPTGQPQSVSSCRFLGVILETSSCSRYLRWVGRMTIVPSLPTLSFSGSPSRRQAVSTIPRRSLPAMLLPDFVS